MRNRWFLLACMLPLLAAAAWGQSTGNSSPEPIEKQPSLYLAVARPMFHEALQPLLDHRREVGMEVMLSEQSPADAVRACKRRPDFVLLVGDDQSGMEDQPWYLPAARVDAVRWRTRQEAQFASDMAAGDIDGDLYADAPVGRLPVRTVEQLRGLVDKILRYEARDASASDLNLPVWAGEAGYGTLANRLATPMLLGILQNNAAPWVEPWIITGDETHPLCGWPPQQTSTFTQRLRAGGAMGCMIGHGSEKMFYSMPFRGRYVVYTDGIARQLLADGEGLSPLIILACLCGDFTGDEESLAEAMLLAPGGPVAVVAATGESHPLPNALTGQGLLLTARRPMPLGTLWLESLRRSRQLRNPAMELLLKGIEGGGSQIDMTLLHRDQQLCYAILGDPATPVRIPQPLEAEVEYSDGTWRWIAHRPEGAESLRVDLQPLSKALPAAATQGDAKARLEVLAAGNARMAFEQLETHDGEGDWSGRVEREGVLRLTTVNGSGVHVAAFKLKRPPSPQQ